MRCLENLHTQTTVVGYLGGVEFTVARGGATCTLTGPAAVVPDEGVQCHSLELTDEGFYCTAGALEEFVPFSDLVPRD